MIVTALFLAGVLACNIVPGRRDSHARRGGRGTGFYSRRWRCDRVLCTFARRHARRPGAQPNWSAWRIRYGIDGGDLHDICFQRPMRQLDPSGLMAAFRADAGYSLTPRSNWSTSAAFPRPVGDLVFPRSGLALNPWRRLYLLCGKATSSTETGTILRCGRGSGCMSSSTA